MNQRFARLLCYAVLMCAGDFATAGAPALQPVPRLQPMPANEALPPPPDQARIDAVAVLLEATHVPEATVASIFAKLQSTPDQRGFAQYMAAHLTKADLALALAPVYARYVTADDAARLTAAFGTPQALRVAQLQQARDRSPISAAGNLANRADRADWDAFNASAPARTIAALERKVNDEVEEAMVVLMRSRSDAAEGQALRDILMHSEAWIKAGAIDAPVLYLPPETGIPHVDRLIKLMATTSWNGSDMSWRYNRDLHALGVRDLLLPPNLVSPEGVAQGLATMDTADARLSAFAHELETCFNALRDGLAPLDMPGGEAARRQIAGALERNLQMLAGTVESQRTLFALSRRVLTFAQQRIGHITLQNGKLIMSSEDIVIYNGMQAESRREVARAGALAERAGRAAKLLLEREPAPAGATP